MLPWDWLLPLPYSLHTIVIHIHNQRVYNQHAAALPRIQSGPVKSNVLLDWPKTKTGFLDW